MRGKTVHLCALFFRCYSKLFNTLNFPPTPIRLIIVDRVKKEIQGMNEELEDAFITFIRTQQTSLYLLAYSYTKNEQDAYFT